MATPFDAAAGGAGIIAISLTAFRGCIKGFELISAIRYMGEDADRLRTILEWEQYRLLEWGSRAGLGFDGVRNPRLRWNLISELLKQLELLLSDTDALKKRYNLVEADHDANQTAPQAKEKRGVRKLWTYVKPDMRTARAQIVQDSVNPLRKLRWVAADREKTKSLANEIGFFNSCLYELLESAQQDFIKDALSVLLQNLISRTTAPADLDLIKALLDNNYIAEASSIDAAASLKQIRLLLNVDQRPDEIKPRTKSSTPGRPGVGKQKLSKLNYQAFTPIEGSLTTNGDRRQLGTYQSTRKNINARVLVEWKTVEKALEAKLLLRIQELTLLMCNISDPSFHSLHCLGYLCKGMEGESDEYAYVFEIADLSEGVAKSVPKVRTLSTLFQGSVLPSLSLRMDLALALAETVQQLHISGWLHKGIRSDNILYLDRDHHTWENNKSLGPYVAGYEFARADNPLEITEDAPSSPELNLYRHPSAQGAVRPSFRKEFDLFALGCVLLEVASWTPLKDILFHAGNDERESAPSMMQQVFGPGEKERLKWETVSRGKECLLEKPKIRKILDQVAFHAGDVYRSVVELCFFPKVEEIEGEEQEASVWTEIEITKMLSQRKV